MAGQMVLPPSSLHPAVSIIIPVYNQLIYTLNCLKSIIENTEGDYEVIVVDDCSIDNSFTVLNRIKNLKVFRNASNTGFIGTCNRGAAESRGQNLFFLNNDTMVVKNWLPPLLKLAERPDVGAVGCKLL